MDGKSSRLKMTTFGGPKRLILFDKGIIIIIQIARVTFIL